MKLLNSIILKAWFLISLNILMTIGAIWVFTRMTPAIEVIIKQNENSLHACEEMLSSLAILNNISINNTETKQNFINAFNRAQNNITEKEEPLYIELIKESYMNAFSGNKEALSKTINAIIQLAKINREAMIRADKKAKHFGNAGAWGVVFMAIGVFFFGMLFKRSIIKDILTPLEEIHNVINANNEGENIRRCTGNHLPKDIKKIYNSINEYLDKTQSINISNK